MDLIITHKEQPRIFVQGLIHSSDPGQYGVNKSGETVSVKTGLKKHNRTAPIKRNCGDLLMVLALLKIQKTPYSR